MNKYLIVGIIIVICALIVGCVSSTSTEQKTEHLQIIWVEYYNSGNWNNDGTIAKIYIPEDNVTCYTFDNYNGGGISCFKDI